MSLLIRHAASDIDRNGNLIPLSISSKIHLKIAYEPCPERPFLS
jgi:hypothetical protein